MEPLIESEDLLSRQLTSIVEESKRLLLLKAEIGRMPNGRRKETSLALISDWYQNPVVIKTGHNTTTENCLLSSSVNPLLQSLGSHSEIPGQQFPDPDDVPF